MTATKYEDNPQRLKELPLNELRQLWADQMGAKPEPKVKGILLRELAWHIQQQVHGGMDTETLTLLRAAKRRSRTGTSDPTPDSDQRRRRARQTSLEPGAKLVRVWRGTKHEVTVLDDGKRFEYRGQVYRSLTRVTEEITGSHWSGPRFFGLHKAIVTRPK